MYVNPEFIYILLWRIHCKKILLHEIFIDLIWHYIPWVKTLLDARLKFMNNSVFIICSEKYKLKKSLMTTQAKDLDV